MASERKEPSLYRFRTWGSVTALLSVSSVGSVALWPILGRPTEVHLLGLVLVVATCGSLSAALVAAGSSDAESRTTPVPPDEVGLLALIASGGVDRDTGLWLLASVIDVKEDAEVFDQWFLELIEGAEQEMDREILALLNTDAEE